jgi:hypothetical protein
MNENKLAAIFARIVREQLGEHLEEIVARNKESAYQNDVCCATQDYCDANMLMDQAFREAGLPTPFDLADDENPHEEACILWGKAWSIAKAVDFQLPAE